eukprot:TRINITY_DN8943_c0_g1_i1.p2 TRINITY_DN8943_c0_g1~~TRINITY_DN8943_c0_g1_i1.p2  ORF type:complete len:137 (+),score=23.63 TRINITY_DN8943_c0_g1_i1:81-491(+)
MPEGMSSRRRQEVRDMQGFADGLDRLVLALTALAGVGGLYTALAIVDGRIEQLYEWTFIGVCVGLALQIASYCMTKRRHAKTLTRGAVAPASVPFTAPPAPAASSVAASSINGGSICRQTSGWVDSMNSVAHTPRD